MTDFPEYSSGPATPNPYAETLNIREKIAHIDQMLADIDRKRQEIRYAPWVLILPLTVGTLTAGAALFAAGAAFMKLFGV